MELEDEEIIEKLQNIFMPHLSTGLKDVEENKRQFIHYTSAENALNIINSEELWLRSPSCMNDYMEISHGYQLLFNFFTNKNHRELFFSTMDACGEGLAQEILNGFDEWWEKIKFDTFIASISLHSEDEKQHGRLSMWRAYGSSGGKAALVLNNPPKTNKNLRVMLSPAIYYTDTEFEEELLKIIANINENQDYLKGLERQTIFATVIAALIILAVSLKHPGFKEEQEWRLVYLPTMHPGHNWLRRSVETINGIPQVIYKLPLKNNTDLNIKGLTVSELIENVIIGPTPYSLAMFDAFNEALVAKGVEVAASRVIISGIPLRT